MSDRTQDLKNLRAVATACKNYVDETKEQILWQVGQYNITTQDDNTTAYQKIVPTGATRAKLKSIGGMSYKCNNIYDSSQKLYSNTSFANGDFITNENYDIYGYFNANSNTTYTLSFYNNYTSASTTRTILYYNGTTLLDVANYMPNANANGTFTFTTPTNTNKILVQTRKTDQNIMLNSGSTALPYEPYFENIRDSVVTSVKSYGSINGLPLNKIGVLTIDENTTYSYDSSAFKGCTTSTPTVKNGGSLKFYSNNSNIKEVLCASTGIYFGFNEAYTSNAEMHNSLIGTVVYYELTNALDEPLPEVLNHFLIDTYTIPSEIQALEGYGRGINENCYNVLDLDTKVFTDKDRVVDLGTLTWTYDSTNHWFRSQTIDTKSTVGGTANCLISNDYTLTSSLSLQGDKVYTIYGTNVFVIDSAYTDATTFKTAMSGVNLQYELATYNITDNLELPDNVIEVEAGGYLVFENTYGQAVPSNITYRIEVAR